MWIYARNYIFCIDCNRLWHLQSGLVLSPNHLFAIPSSKFNSVSNLLLLSLVFLFRCILYKYEFLLHGENEMRQYTLLEAIAWSWRHSAQFSVAYFTKIISLLEAVAWSWRHSAQFSAAYFTKIISLLLHWMSYMLYTSPARGQNKVARAQDLQGKLAAAIQ